MLWTKQTTGVAAMENVIKLFFIWNFIITECILLLMQLFANLRSNIIFIPFYLFFEIVFQKVTKLRNKGDVKLDSQSWIKNISIFFARNSIKSHQHQKI